MFGENIHYCNASGCSCEGHRLPGIHHVVPCCDEPHIEFVQSTNPDQGG